MRDDLPLHLGQARAAETAHHAFRDRENLRQAGVAWSGLSLPALAPRTETELHILARDRQLAAQTWRDRPEGGFLTAIAAVQRAAARLHADAEQARAGAARGLAGEQAGCAALLRDLRRQTRQIAAGLREAQGALDRSL